MLRPLRLVSASAPGLLALTLWASPAGAQCPEEPPLTNFSGPGQVVCPCFVENEEAGATFEAPAEDYPLEILRVGIGWASQFGGAPQSLENSINFYNDGLPDPGPVIASFLGPVLTDGFINEFDLTDFASEVPITSGEFTVTLDFLNENAGSFFAPSMVHDGLTCQPGQNVVFAIPGGWFDACVLGVNGNWVVYVVYRPLNCGLDAPERVLASTETFLAVAPNPAREATRVEFFLRDPSNVDLGVYDVRGRRVAELANRTFAAGAHGISWDARTERGERAVPGVYFVRLQTATGTRTEKLVIAH